MTLIATLPPSDSPSVPLRTCSRCGHDYPLTEFRRHTKGGDVREHDCRLCANSAMRRYRARKRSKALRQFAAEVAKSDNINRVSQLCEAMFNRFGGPEKFGRLWASEIQAAQANRSGSASALKAMTALMHMQMLVQSTPQPNLWRGLSDDEVREVTEHKMREMLRANPELLAAGCTN